MLCSDIDIIEKARNNTLSMKMITHIIINYRIYSLYLLKYITVKYPVLLSKILMYNIVKSIKKKNREGYNMLNYILTTYSIKLCDNILIDDIICINGCICHNREYWYIVYTNIINMVNIKPVYFLAMTDMYYCLILLLLKTDVVDNRLLIFLKHISNNTDNWINVIFFIKYAKLYGTQYGDIIFHIGNMLIKNDRLPKNQKNINISSFTYRHELSYVMRQYNIMQKNINIIVDNLYVTDYVGACNICILYDKNIQHIISLTKKPIFKANKIKYTHIVIDDDDNNNFIEKTIDTAIMANTLIKQNITILIHCNKGLSRSVCFIILMLMCQGITFDDALNIVKKRKNNIDPNPNFIKQLSQFKVKLK